MPSLAGIVGKQSTSFLSVLSDQFGSEAAQGNTNNFMRSIESIRRTCQFRTNPSTHQNKPTMPRIWLALIGSHSTNLARREHRHLISQESCTPKSSAATAHPTRQRSILMTTTTTTDVFESIEFQNGSIGVPQHRTLDWLDVAHKVH